MGMVRARLKSGPPRKTEAQKSEGGASILSGSARATGLHNLLGHTRDHPGPEFDTTLWPWYALSCYMPKKTPRKRTNDVGMQLPAALVVKKNLQFIQGQKIFQQGDPADCVFLIQEGIVKITIVNEQGKEAVITLLEIGDFVGESCISNGSPFRITSASAIKPTTLVVIQKKEMLQALHGDKAFADRFIAYMLKRNLKVESDLVDQLFNSTEKRLARALLLLAQYGKDGKPETTVANISQETLAELVGTTRSRVNFFMNKFRKLGFIHYNGGMQVHSSLLNVVLHD
jgi:CRP/FNR family cyclic AMP-dependent transcriptional regulator